MMCIPQGSGVLDLHMSEPESVMCDAGTDHQHEMQCTLQGISAPQPIRPVRTTHTASHLEQKLSLHPTGSDRKLLPRNTAFAASHLEARSTLHPK